MNDENEALYALATNNNTVRYTPEIIAGIIGAGVGYILTKKVIWSAIGAIAGVQMVNITAAPAEAGISEGNYTEWEHKWTKDLSGIAGNIRLRPHINEGDGIVVLQYRDLAGDEIFSLYNLSDATNIFTSPAGSDYMVGLSNPWAGYSLSYGVADFGTVSRSIERYVTIVRSDNVTIEIWRKLSTLLWSRDITAEVAGTTIKRWTISVTGKYLLIATANARLILYEGS